MPLAGASSRSPRHRGEVVAVSEQLTLIGDARRAVSYTRSRPPVDEWSVSKSGERHEASQAKGHVHCRRLSAHQNSADPAMLTVRRVTPAPKRSRPGEGLHGPHEMFGAIPVIAVPAEARRGGGEQDDAVAAGPVERGTGGLVQVVALADVEVRRALAEGVGDARPALGHAQDQQVRPTA